MTHIASGVDMVVDAAHGISTSHHFQKMYCAQDAFAQLKPAIPIKLGPFFGKNAALPFGHLSGGNQKSAKTALQTKVDTLQKLWLADLAKVKATGSSPSDLGTIKSEVAAAKKTANSAKMVTMQARAKAVLAAADDKNAVKYK
jgi:hypothetical protein